MEHAKTCPMCGKQFTGSSRKKYCKPCLKERLAAAQKAYKMRTVGKKRNDDAPARKIDPAKHAGLILELVKERVSLPRIAMRIGCTATMLIDRVANAPWAKDIREAIAEREAADEAIRRVLPKSFLFNEATAANMARHRAVSWLWG